MKATVRMSAAEYRNVASTKKRSKYGSVRTEVDGIKFASKAEAQYYQVLKMRERLGEVISIRNQVPYALQGLNSHVVTTYYADFVFHDIMEGRERVVDVKGGDATQTALFKLKAKLMQDNHGITVEIVGGGS